MMKFCNFLLASLLVFIVFFWQPTDRSVSPTIPNFQISTVDGNFFLKKLSDDKNVLLFFGYTFCPDICPTTLLELSAALNQLPGAKLDNLSVFFITLDPKRDTPQYLQEYVNFFHPKIHGATAQNLEKMAKHFGVIYRQNAEPPFLIDHTADIIVIPKSAHARPNLFTIPFGTKSTEIAKILEEKL